MRQRRNDPEEISAVTAARTAEANVTNLREELRTERNDRIKGDNDLWEAVRELEEHVRPWPDQHPDSPPTHPTID
jgi:hypothetical protein